MMKMGCFRGLRFEAIFKNMLIFCHLFCDVLAPLSNCELAWRLLYNIEYVIGSIWFGLHKNRLVIFSSVAEE